MSDKYARNPDYGKPPQWGRLYGKHFPRDTDGCSRHVKIIANDILRAPESPVRRLLIDAGYEPDHWAHSMEVTIKLLWEARAELWKVDPIGQQRKFDRAMKRAKRAAK